MVAGMWLFMGAAEAGDLYLRGGIGLDRPGDMAFTDTDCASTAPAALYGCGTGGDGAPYRSHGDFGTPPAVELGLGYATGDAMRFEVLVEYRPRFTFEGRANFLAPERRQSVSAELSSVSGMLAGYLDLAVLGVPKLGPVAPFIGSGVGAVRARIGETTMAFPATTTTVPGGSRVDLAWMATAGSCGATGAASRCRSISRRPKRGSEVTVCGFRCGIHSEHRPPARRGELCAIDGLVPSCPPGKKPPFRS